MDYNTRECIDVSCSLMITKENKELCLKAYKVFKDYIHFNIEEIEMGRRVDLTYDFNITYLDGIESRLGMLIKLFDIADKKKIDFKVLTKVRMESYILFRLCSRLLKLVK